MRACALKQRIVTKENINDSLQFLPPGKNRLFIISLSKIESHYKTVNVQYGLSVRKNTKRPHAIDILIDSTSPHLDKAIIPKIGLKVKENRPVADKTTGKSFIIGLLSCKKRYFWL